MMSHHALTRAQKRSIPPLAIDLLFECGASCSAGGGTEMLYFDKRAWKRVGRMAGRDAQRHSNWRDVYLIVKEGTIITTGWRTERIRH